MRMLEHNGTKSYKNTLDYREQYFIVFQSESSYNTLMARISVLSYF